MDYCVVIAAAGQGKRMRAGRNKQFITLGKWPVIVHTMNVFQKDANCKEMVIVTSPQERTDFEHLINQYEITKVTKIVNGGKERQESVYRGLKQLSCEREIVLIHDGARPFIESDQIAQVTKAAVHHGAAVLAVPVKDTIKREKEMKVTETVDRSSLWAVQTPQAFRLSLIKKAPAYAQERGITATDDASLVEQLGDPVAIVPGDEHNIKLTTPHDLLVARAILKKRGESGFDSNWTRF